MSYRFIGIISCVVFVISVIICYSAVKFYNSLQSYNDGLIIKKSLIQDADNGVFTTKFIPKGTFVEICPIIIDNKQKLVETNIIDYVFDGAQFGEGLAILALGYGGMYNHSDENNCSHYMDIDNNKMIITAKRDIDVGEELYVNYGEDWWNTRNKIKK